MCVARDWCTRTRSSVTRLERCWFVGGDQRVTGVRCRHQAPVEAGALAGGTCGAHAGAPAAAPVTRRAAREREPDVGQ